MRGFITGKLLAILGVLVVVGYLLMDFLFPKTGIDDLPPNERLNLKKNIVVLGVDERPEEVTDMKESIIAKQNEVAQG